MKYTFFFFAARSLVDTFRSGKYLNLLHMCRDFSRSSLYRILGESFEGFKTLMPTKNREEGGGEKRKD